MSNKMTTMNNTGPRVTGVANGMISVTDNIPSATSNRAVVNHLLKPRFAD